ncbi:hypothetical protein OZN62_05375 [Aurantiacibacter sp. MUD11]|uniref:hypothetical protein n=1 Tax=Aurantiacibacter sp. MUD11 TaxID=3003265 RepID=UPI0022AAFFB4|nr:hypothetical protein [Aurantiacibacter sp. MUD11]WAT18999.1 hypothetical protein OZN62_05375 [Aurantiacibacter sp. MUD11]
MIRHLLAASLLFAAPASLAAQETLPDNLAERMAGARSAEATARQMGEVLQANAIAQRQYAGMVAGDLGGGYRGALSLPGEDLGVWLTTIVGQPGGEDAPLVALAEYEIAQGEILAETIFPAGQAPVLDGDRVAMARAQIVAPRAVIAAPEASFCHDGEDAGESDRTSVTYLTLAMPPREDGSFEAYVLNGPFEGSAMPLGKHYRVDFDEFGVIGSPELLTDTCEIVRWAEDDPELAMSVYVTEFDAGQWPNEIHAFISAQLPMSMGVVTGDIIWPMAGGMIAPPVPAAEAGY